MRLLIPLAIAALVLSAPAAGQCWLTTTFANDNGQDGNIFDIVALNPVTITGFDVNLDVGTWTVEVYTCFFGSYVGYDGDPLVWSLVGSGTVGGNGPGIATPLPFALSVPIAAGATQGFYVTATTGSPINYTSGTMEGAIFAADANIQVLEGLGMGYPFGFSFTPRVWNGNVYYTGGTSGYQVNQPASSLSVNGTADPGACLGLSHTFQSGDPFTLTLDSTLAGNPYDLAVTVGAGIVTPATGGYELPDGQFLNLDFASLDLVFSPNLPPHPGTVALAVNAPPVVTPTTFALQQVVVDPAQGSGLSLSRAVEITVNPFPKMRVEASGFSSQNSATSSGFWRVTHFGPIAPFPADSIVSVTFDFAASTDPDIAARMFDTDQDAMADRFDGGNSTLAGCSGTYRNNTDALRGLDYATTLVSPCDPAALTGWTATNPGAAAGDWQTITFPFLSGSFTAGNFEFDADTDGPGSHTGGGQAGTVVTVVTQGSGGMTTYTGALAPDPADQYRSFIFFY